MKSQPSLSIRPFDWPDEQAVVDLWQACNLIVAWNDPHRDIRLKMDFQPDLFFVGELDGRIIATIMAGYEGHRGWINYLAVHPDFQKQGFGKKLITSGLRPDANILLDGLALQWFTPKGWNPWAITTSRKAYKGIYRI